MPAGYHTNGLAADRREARTVGHDPAVDRGVIDLAAAGESAEWRARALRLLAVGVGDHTPIEVIVRPVMLAAGVPPALAHPHFLRHT